MASFHHEVNEGGKDAAVVVVVGLVVMSKGCAKMFSSNSPLFVDLNCIFIAIGAVLT